MTSKTMTAETGLKACPFCGDSPRLKHIEGLRPLFIIGCRTDNCPATPRVSGDSEAEVIEGWNTRAGPAQGAQGQLWSASKHDEIIKRLMADIGHPNSQSIYGAFKQFANELHALSLPSTDRETDEERRS